MNNKRLMIIISVIIILLLVILLIICKSMNKSGLNENSFSETPYDMYEVYMNNRAKEGITANSAKAHIESDISEYYTIESIIKSFNLYVSYLYGTAKDLNIIVNEQNEKEILDQYREKGYNYINDTLANNYKKNYDVDKQYIYDYFKSYAGMKYLINDIYVVEDSDIIKTCYVYGTFGDTEFNYIVILDKYNFSFEVYLDNYMKDKQITKNDSSSMKTQYISKIERNNSNEFMFRNISEEQMARIYFEEYVNIMENNPERAYNLLNSEYKSKRFKNFEEFKSYIDYRLNFDIKSKFSSYSVNKVNDYLEITCKNVMDGNITFRATGAKRYTVILDSYTLNLELYEKKYKAQKNDANKAKLCFDTFLECVNSKDYQSAYKYLNKEYRINNFKTVEEFSEYVQSKWFDTNLYLYDTFKVSGDSIIISGNLMDKSLESSTEEKNFYNKSFVIKFGEKYNEFEISFVK